MNERGRKNARCKAMERNTITTTITTTRETRAHIPGNDNDDGTILTETFVFLDFLVASPSPFLIQIGCCPPTSFSRSPSLSKPTTNYYDEDCTLSHKRIRYIPTLTYEIAISHRPRPPRLQDSCPSLSSPSSDHTYGILWDFMS